MKPFSHRDDRLPSAAAAVVVVVKVFAASVFLVLLLSSSSYGHIHVQKAFISSSQNQYFHQQIKLQQLNNPTTRGRGRCVGGVHHHRHHHRIFPQEVPQQKQHQERQPVRHQRRRSKTISSTTTLSASISFPSLSSSSSGNNNNATTFTTERTTTDEGLELTPSQDDERDHRELMARSSPVTTFETLEECLSSMDGKSTNSDLTVVLFVAHYCKKCHEAYKSYKRIASSNPPSIDFTRIETSLMSLHQLRLVGVSRVPFIQIYRNGSCVASFAASSPPSSKLESQLQATIDSCQQRSKTDWMKFCQHHREEIQHNKNARQTIRSKIVRSSPFSSRLSTKWTQDQHEHQHHRRPSTVTTIVSERQLLLAIDTTNTSITGSRERKGSTFFDDDIVESSTIGNDDGGNEFVMNDSSNNNHNDNNGKPAVILFHSRFGHASLRAQRQFTTIAEDQNHYIGKFVFFRIDSSTLSDTTLKGLGVSTYHPHIQIYKDGRCVASFSIPQTYIFTRMVRGSLDECIQRTEQDQWNDFMNQFADDISSIQQTVDSIRRRQVGP